MWLTIGVVDECMSVELCSVIRVLELFEKGAGLPGKSVNTWHPQPLFQQSSLTVPHTEPGLVVKAHTQLWKCTKPPCRLSSPSHCVTSRNSLFPQSESDREKYNRLRLNHFLSPK